jgi:biotin carboxyl carrier protein
MRYRTSVDGQGIPVEILDEHRTRIGGQLHAVDFTSVNGQPLYSLLIDGKSFEAYVYPDEDGWQVILVGRQYHVQVVDEREARLDSAKPGPTAADKEFLLRAPMPGLVAAVPVEEGQSVDKGQILLILESMKMQNELRAPRAGKVVNLRAQPGQSVEQKQVLMTVI